MSFHCLKPKLKLSGGDAAALPLNLDWFFFVKWNCRSESSQSPGLWHFETPAPETFKISAGDALLWSDVWNLDLHELAGPRASGNVRREWAFWECRCVVPLYIGGTRFPLWPVDLKLLENKTFFHYGFFYISILTAMYSYCEEDKLTWSH